MPLPVTTLRTLLAEADRAFASGQVRSSLASAERLLSRAVERNDRLMTVSARALMARCHLLRRDLDAAADQLQAAGPLLDPDHVESTGRYQAAHARLVAAGPDPAESRAALHAYLAWAEDADDAAHIADACLLLADVSGPDATGWLERVVDVATLRGVHVLLGPAANRLADALDRDGRAPEALEAYRVALDAHRSYGTARQVAATAWAVGALAVRLDDPSLARATLEEALALAVVEPECADLEPRVLLELARVADDAGDRVEARHLILRAVRVARDHGLHAYWPDTWEDLVRFARGLELDV